MFGVCFFVWFKLLGGMSGSLIFDDENIYVYGVVSSGWEDEIGLIKYGYGLMFVYFMSLFILLFNNFFFFDVIKLGEYGML